jgi:CubicO group peptidase (beta-lactamase class C family)
MAINALGAFGQSLPALQQSLDALYRSVYNNPNDPGAAVLVLHHGEPLFEQCYGMANYDTGERVTMDTRFCLASVSKQFSAVAVLQLAERGLLSLDDTVNKWFPEFKADFWKRITLRQLLSHTSGVPDARDRADRHFKLTATDVQSVGYMVDLDHLNFEPGCGRYEYINPTFQLVYQLVERVTGQSFETYMHDNVFVPAGMDKVTYFEDGRHIDHMAHGYTPDGKSGKYKEFDYGEETFFATKADGGLYCSIREFAQWEIALRDLKVLSRASRDAAYSPHVILGPDANYGYQPHTGYGYGFFIQHEPNRQAVVYHTGDNGGFTIYAGKIPDSDVVLLFFSTRDNIDRMGMVNRSLDLIRRHLGLN